MFQPSPANETTNVVSARPSFGAMWIQIKSGFLVLKSHNVKLKNDQILTDGWWLTVTLSQPERPAERSTQENKRKLSFPNERRVRGQNDEDKS